MTKSSGYIRTGTWNDFNVTLQQMATLPDHLPIGLKSNPALHTTHEHRFRNHVFSALKFTSLIGLCDEH